MNVRDLPRLPQDDAYVRDLSDLVARVNGFVYPGDRADAICDAVRVLRNDPELARRLLEVAP